MLARKSFLTSINLRAEGCPFCPLEIKTELHFHDPVTNIYVVTDLNSKGYKFRLLSVGSGPSWHKNWNRYSQEERQALMNALLEVAHRLEKEGRGELVCLDNSHFSYPAHGHLQGCFR